MVNFHMKELSSDFTYYKNTLGLIVVPIFIGVNIGLFWKNTMPDSIVYVSYVLLFIFTVNQSIRWFHCRKVNYDGSRLLLKSYLRDQSQIILVTQIVKIKFMYNFSVKKERELIKVSFVFGGKLSNIYFFRNSDKTSLDNLLAQVESSKNNY
jgi:hypothetical protein